MKLQDTSSKLEQAANAMIYRLSVALNFPAFTVADVFDVSWGLIQGGVSVLPDSSLITYCKTNASALPATYTSIGTNFGESKTTDALKSVQQLIIYFHGTVFNCFYSVTDPVGSAQYNKKFSLLTTFWNVIFNLGYMYTNGKFFYTFATTVVDPSATDTRSWETFGKNLGSFLIRFIYSKYVPRDFCSSVTKKSIFCPDVA